MMVAEVRTGIKNEKGPAVILRVFNFVHYVGYSYY